MKRWLVAVVLGLCSLPAVAQDALVVQTCGTLPQAYNAGATRQQTVDVNGRLCLTGSPVFANLSIVAGTLTDQQSAFTLTATQPTTITGTQSAVSWTITSAGSSSQLNIGFLLTYAAGYTGSSSTYGERVVNSTLGTGNTPVPATNNVIGNQAIYGLVNGAGSGLNVGVVGAASNATGVNAGVVALGQTTTAGATNIGLIASGVNTGGGAVQIGAFISNNQTTLPNVSAGLIVDNGSQAISITLFRNNNSTVASVTQTGGVTATLTTAIGADVVCNAGTSNSALTLQVSATGCAASSARFKEGIASIAPRDALAIVQRMEPVRYRYRADYPERERVEHIGFTAEQISSIRTNIPGYSLATFEDDGVTPHAVKYNEMAPLWAGAIQQLKAEFDAYKLAHP